MIVPPYYSAGHSSEYPSNTPFSNIGVSCGGDLSLFGQVKNIAIVPALYMWMDTNGATQSSAIGVTSANFTTRAKNRMKALIKSTTREFAYSGRMSSDYPVTVMRNILSPNFTPGSPIMQDMEVGGYQKQIGHNPATLTFRLPITYDGDNNAPGMFPSYWLDKLSRMIVPGMYGVFLQNSGKDVLAIGVNLTNSSGSALADIVPIPIIDISNSTPALGNFEEPGYTEVTLTLAPNWDNPYPMGKCLWAPSSGSYPQYWSRGSKPYIITRQFLETIT